MTRNSLIHIAALVGLLTLSGCVSATATTPPSQTSPTPSANATLLLGSATETSVAFPTPHQCRAEIVEQTYEGGRMFWVGRGLVERCKEQHDFALSSGEIWVLIFDKSGETGEWYAFVDTWDSETEIPFDIAATQPPDLVQPVRGFGKVWRERLTDDQRTALGWATGSELKFVTDYRYDAGGFVDNQGTYVPRPGLHTLLSRGGERFFLDEQTGSFEYIPAD